MKEDTKIKLLVFVDILVALSGVLILTVGDFLLYYFVLLSIILVLINAYFVYTKRIGDTKKNELAIIKSEFKNTEDLINLLRRQGHDHINHIQTINAMLMLKEYDIAQSYIQGISTSYRFSGHFLRLGNHTLTAVVNTKKELANKKGINFIVEKFTRVKLEEVKPWDIVSIVSNLFDNAIEYLLLEQDIEPNLYFSIQHTDDMKGYILKVGNNYIDRGMDIGKFFEEGFSTKADSGRGMGLYIAKQVLESYGWNIRASINDNRIDFIVEMEDTK